LRTAAWRWRGSIALLGIAVAFVIYPLIEGPNDVINSDWPAFATGAQLILHDPGHLYDVDAQRRVEFQVTGGKTLVTLGINGILPFLAPAWVALVAVPFDLLGTNIGGRLWILFGLACLGLGLYLAVRPRPPSTLPAFASVLPAFAGVPTALMMLNAQLDGLVALGIGAAIALWSRPYLAGLALGLTLMKPQLVLPLGAALLFSRQWRVLAGWAAAGVLLWGSVAVLNPRWVLDWLRPTGSTITPGSREVDLPHLGTLLPAGSQTLAVATLSLAAIIVVVLLAWRCRKDFPSAAALLVAGGVLAAPHALPADLVIVAVAIAIWGRARGHDWLLLSVGAAFAGFVPAPWPAFVGVVVIGWLCVRISVWRRVPAPASAG
jgi:Glycosyltransferase family 87